MYRDVGRSDWALNGGRRRRETMGRRPARSAAASSRVRASTRPTSSASSPIPTAARSRSFAQASGPRRVGDGRQGERRPPRRRQDQAFAKSLKRAVTVAPDLPQTVEALFVKRALKRCRSPTRPVSSTTGASKRSRRSRAAGALRRFCRAPMRPRMVAQARPCICGCSTFTLADLSSRLRVWSAACPRRRHAGGCRASRCS